MNLGWSLIILLGGFGLFIHGLDSTSQAFRVGLGDRVRMLMSRLSERKVFSFSLGLLLVFATQSSTAADAFAMGLVEAGFLTLPSAFLFVMGSSVGGAFVTLLLTLRLVLLAPALLAVSVAFSHFGKGPWKRWGAIAEGISLVLTGMFLIKLGMNPLVSQGGVREALLLATKDLPLLFAFSFFLTSLIQSSSAIAALAIALASSELLSLSGIVSIILGAHLGSATIVLLSGFGYRPNGRILAWGDFYYKAFGVVIGIPLALFYVSATGGLPIPFARHVAYFQILLVSANALFMIPFRERLIEFARTFAPGFSEESIGDPLFLDPLLAPFPELALPLLSRELTRLANYLEEFLNHILFKSAPSTRKQRLKEELSALSNACDSFLASIPVPLEPETLRREYRNLAYAQSALRDMVLLATTDLYTLYPAPGGGGSLWKDLLDCFMDLCREAFGAFALGDRDFASRALELYRVFRSLEDRIRAQEAEQGEDTMEQLRLLDCLPVLHGIARGAYELARGLYLASSSERRESNVLEKTGPSKKRA